MTYHELNSIDDGGSSKGSDRIGMEEYLYGGGRARVIHATLVYPFAMIIASSYGYAPGHFERARRSTNWEGMSQYLCLKTNREAGESDSCTGVGGDTVVPRSAGSICIAGGYSERNLGYLKEHC